MAKIQKEAKLFIYFQNALFLLFNEFIRNPEKVGERIGDILSDTVCQVFPDRKELTNTITKVRTEWFEQFKCGLQKSLKKGCE